MIDWGVAALTLMVVSAPSHGATMPLLASTTQVTIREQIIIRMRRSGRPRRPPSPPVEWKERKGPDCVPASDIAGALLRSRSSIDLMLKNRVRLRAKLVRNCPALDYYNGFYITPNPDGMICADRDAIRSRMGGECGIEEFKRLRAVAKD